MVTACYAAPTLCDIVKHVQDMVNQIFQFKGLSCQQAETLLAGIGGRLSGARTSRCISQRQRAGSTLAAAEQACRTRSAPGIRDARTGREVAAGSSTDLIRDTLKRGQDNLGRGDPDTDAGMIDVQTFAEEVLGRFELKRGATDDEPLDVDITPPTKRVHDVYRIERQPTGLQDRRRGRDHRQSRCDPERRQAQERYRCRAWPCRTGCCGRCTTSSRSIRAAYAGYRDKLAGNFTMLALSWRVGELRDLLEAGMLDNTELSEAEADIIKARLARLERERDRFISEKELVERHAVPVLQAILQDHRERKQGGAPHDGRRRGGYGDHGQPLRRPAPPGLRILTSDQWPVTRADHDEEERQCSAYKCPVSGNGVPAVCRGGVGCRSWPGRRCRCSTAP